MNGDPYRSPSGQKGLSHEACSILCRNEPVSRPTTNKQGGGINSIPSSRNLRTYAPISLIGVMVAIILGLSLTNIRLGIYILNPAGVRLPARNRNESRSTISG